MAKSEDRETAERLLDAAEALFGERSIESSSLREITGRARANLSAVSYYFGSKQGLLKAVVARRVASLTAERNRLLDLAESAAGRRPPSPESVLDAYMGPALRLSREHPAFMRFLARLLVQDSGALDRLLESDGVDATCRRFEAALGRALPGVSPDEVSWALTFLTGAMMHTWTRWQDSAGRRGVPGGEEILKRLVSFGAAGIKAAAGGGK